MKVKERENERELGRDIKEKKWGNKKEEQQMKRRETDSTSEGAKSKMEERERGEREQGENQRG